MQFVWFCTLGHCYSCEGVRKKLWKLKHRTKKFNRVNPLNCWRDISVCILIICDSSQYSWHNMANTNKYFVSNPIHSIDVCFTCPQFLFHWHHCYIPLALIWADSLSIKRLCLIDFVRSNRNSCECSIRITFSLLRWIYHLHLSRFVFTFLSHSRVDWTVGSWCETLECCLRRRKSICFNVNRKSVVRILISRFDSYS